MEEVDPQEVVKKVKSQAKKEAPPPGTSITENGNLPPPEPLGITAEKWKQCLHQVLTQSLSPAAFERLVQRVLRESVFVQVEVTGKTGDGGIDGRGMLE